MSDSGPFSKGFWESGLIRGAVAMFVGGLVSVIKAFGIDLTGLADQIVDGLIGLGIMVAAVIFIAGRIRKPNRPTIDPSTVPTVVAKVTGTGAGK